MEVIYFISGLVSLAAVICFFVMCANVASIKRQTLKRDDYYAFLSDFRMYEAFGDNDKAREQLKRLLWSDIEAVKRLYTAHGSEKVKAELNKIREKFKSSLERYGVEFPDIEKLIKPRG